MDASKEIQMKQHVLNMLKDFMMGEESKKFAPKAIQVEMVGKPKESLLEDAHEEPMEEMPEDMHDEMPMEDEEDEDKKPRMSLKDFLASRE